MFQTQISLYLNYYQMKNVDEAQHSFPAVFNNGLIVHRTDNAVTFSVITDPVLLIVLQKKDTCHKKNNSA